MTNEQDGISHEREAQTSEARLERIAQAEGACAIVGVLDRSVDTDTTSQKAQTVIELARKGYDKMAEQVLEEDLPERFTYRDSLDFMEAVEDRYRGGNPMNFFQYYGQLDQWGVPILRLNEDYMYDSDEEEHYTDLLDDALRFFDEKELVDSLQGGEVISYDGNDIADTYVLGWGGDEKESLRENTVVIDPSWDENRQTVVEVEGDERVIRNAAVRIMFGFEDEHGPTYRATYLVDLSVNQKGKIKRLGEPYYISVWDGGNTVKGFENEEDA